MRVVAAIIALCIVGIVVTAIIGALGLTPDIEALAAYLLGVGGSVLLVVIVLAIVFVYFLPTVVALLRHKQNTLAIFLLNLFLGWTFVGWVFAIIWAATVDR